MQQSIFPQGQVRVALNGSLSQELFWHSVLQQQSIRYSSNTQLSTPATVNSVLQQQSIQYSSNSQISTPVTVNAGSTQLWSLQAFDYDTGRPKRYVEMLSWPRAHRLHRALPTVLAGVFWESFVPTKAAATMRMVLNRYSRPSKCFERIKMVLNRFLYPSTVTGTPQQVLAPFRNENSAVRRSRWCSHKAACDPAGLAKQGKFTLMFVVVSGAHSFHH